MQRHMIPFNSIEFYEILWILMNTMEFQAADGLLNNTLQGLWSGMVWLSLAWPGQAWPGLDRPGLSWPGLAWPLKSSKMSKFQQWQTEATIFDTFTFVSFSIYLFWLGRGLSLPGQL